MSLLQGKFSFELKLAKCVPISKSGQSDKATNYILYACETWTLTAHLQRRLQAMKMACYKRLLNISYTERVTSEEVHNSIKHAIGPYDDLLTTVKRRKIKLYGHATKSSGLSNTLLQRPLNGGRRGVVREMDGVNRLKYL